MDFKNLKPSLDIKEPATIATLVGSVLLLLASFLPIETAKVSFMSMSESTSRNLMGDYHHQGIFLLILAIATVVILVLGLDRQKFLNSALGASAAVGLWGIINGITGLSATKKDFKDSGVDKYASTSFSIGFFVLILGVIAIVGAIVLINMNSKKSTPAQAQPMM